MQDTTMKERPEKPIKAAYTQPLLVKHGALLDITGDSLDKKDKDKDGS